MLALFGLDNLLLSGGRDNVIRCALHPKSRESSEAGPDDNHALAVLFSRSGLWLCGTARGRQGTGWNWDVRG